MNCLAVRDHLTALVDGELTQASAAQVREHLTQCADCREEYVAQTALRKAARAWEVEGGGDVWAVVRREIEQPRLSDLLDEIRRLRTELQTLRVEVADLRRQRSAYPSTAPLSTPSVRAFPYAAAPSDLPVNIP